MKKKKKASSAISAADAPPEEKRTLFDEKAIRRVLNRLAAEIVEGAGGVEHLALIGIHTGGVYLAQRLREIIRRTEGEQPPMGMVDITLYRDDIAQSLPQPQVGPTSLDFKLSDMNVVLVDDVLFTGRTVRSALDALMDFGRPRAIRLAVLVDRLHRELPIAADYVGVHVETRAHEHIEVFLREYEGVENDAVVLLHERIKAPPAKPTEKPAPAVNRQPGVRKAAKKRAASERAGKTAATKSVGTGKAPKTAGKKATKKASATKPSKTGVKTKAKTKTNKTNRRRKKKS